ncbi:uncharacterized protein LOC116574048 [Mustela erminea]|uniref:uncharacterized protein LOC116574048 n=1 Tax=Mustela erminea TaxID=36723 RepID=UPI001386D202|nr:uncharacterized protein LOC116574048 [Mustela erminea]
MDYTSINVSDQSLEEKKQHKEDNDVSEVSKDFSDKVVSPLNLRIRKPVMQIAASRSARAASSPRVPRSCGCRHDPAPHPPPRGSPRALAGFASTYPRAGLCAGSWTGSRKGDVSVATISEPWSGLCQLLRPRHCGFSVSFPFLSPDSPRAASEYSGEWLPPHTGPARGLSWEILEQREGTSDHVRGREARQVFVSGLPRGPARAKGGRGVPWTDAIRTSSGEKVLPTARANLPCVPRMAMTTQAQGCLETKEAVLESHSPAAPYPLDEEACVGSLGSQRSKSLLNTVFQPISSTLKIFSTSSTHASTACSCPKIITFIV